MNTGWIKALTVFVLVGFLGACGPTVSTPGPTGPDYAAVFETKRGVVLTARPTELAIYDAGQVRHVAATAFLIREAGSGEIIEITEQGASAFSEGDRVMIVYGPETRVVNDN